MPKISGPCKIRRIKTLIPGRKNIIGDINFFIDEYGYPCYNVFNPEYNIIEQFDAILIKKVYYKKENDHENF